MAPRTRLDEEDEKEDAKPAEPQFFTAVPQLANWLPVGVRSSFWRAACLNKLGQFGKLSGMAGPLASGRS